MDHMMPDMDGIETTKHIREMGVTTPIVALSANAVAGARELFISSGMDGFISKPIIAAELNDVLYQFLQPDSIILGDAPKNFHKHDKNGKGQNKILDKLRESLSLDTKTGLVNNNNDAVFYMKTIRSVAGELPKELQSLKAEYEAKDWKNFGIRAHALKGMLATIGAEALSSSAKDLEFAAKESRFDECENNGPPFIDALKGFEDTLSAIVKAEEASGNKDVAQDEHAAATHSTVNDSIDALAEALDGGNKKLIKQRMSELSKVFVRLDIGKIEELIDNYDYEEAAKTLRAARMTGG
jgi:CheY-like chemotaxis protein